MESLRIYNTLARDKQVFVPRQPGEVRMYVCGITVYDYCHVGHARMLVVFDLVQRWLRAIGYRVTYVRNITDIDDKIIRRAVENGETIKSLTDRFIDAMHEDEDALGIQRPDIEPRATQFIPQMLGMIERLEANGYAYQATDGDVNYSVRKFANYGKLSGKSLDDLRAGERVAANDAKEDPLDFVLWKRAKADDPEGASWESKYGMGRPGWHIECSAMGCTLLGEHFDIHGGGQDLQFPHHENEIAQSEGATGQTFVNYWLHNGFVQVDNEKMSKSLGNFFTIREVLERYDAEVMRFFIVRTHYRSPLNYSDVHLDDARASLTRLYTALKDVEPDALALDWNEPHAQRFAAAMNDDFNTPVAIATLFELAGEVNRTRDASLARQLKQLAGLLGLLGREPRAFLQQASGAAQAGALSVDEIEAKIAARAAAKRAKDYAEADRIRAELLDAGVALEDKPGGSTEWRRV
ncbi:cysteine--tRNA ligase [Burkholderia multivorans]|uniref:Cysteine--tRNA ligase n=2 Tax=Burkholderia multivorans TaxID=87883 RepID=SYC_BURM1|nr:cysteine--tRNA ligase [Burkholderia multivorans]A9AHN6.1 RecName: Full=Cysteine--tRNA ligase; AltName: Full=Cysteinyl-tRNA synthetase; Short=CysRS [Burkholderia multivorans ATCC 17616]ABX14891.1 cysteinyl-tRNA synthetase [Burkholderia multivorans ATCC 17616]AYY59339.1 cysteine--tRNA ligase [Burkholderia multivorans]KVT43058.1 cysteine--tRNA ligase [Burkholderia multivorans]MBJ9616328.1 cysteine--tRNA ligase [Burkholderia multivorans]MBR7900505.1 cysteine--tRNA ligase [Burkholderia multivor